MKISLAKNRFQGPDAGARAHVNKANVTTTSSLDRNRTASLYKSPMAKVSQGAPSGTSLSAAGSGRCRVCDLRRRPGCRAGPYGCLDLAVRSKGERALLERAKHKGATASEAFSATGSQGSFFRAKNSPTHNAV